MNMVIMGGGKGRLEPGPHYAGAQALCQPDRNRQDSLPAAGGRSDATVIRGDGTNVSVLEAAGTENCDVFMAVTGHDQDNLVAAQLAKEHFHAKKVIARGQ